MSEEQRVAVHGTTYMPMVNVSSYYMGRLKIDFDSYQVVGVPVYWCEGAVWPQPAPGWRIFKLAEAAQ
jgi:hypothetical protein